MTKDVEHFIKRCSTCKLAKNHVLPQGLYSPYLFLKLLRRMQFGLHHWPAQNLDKQGLYHGGGWQVLKNGTLYSMPHNI